MLEPTIRMTKMCVLWSGVRKQVNSAQKGSRFKTPEYCSSCNEPAFIRVFLKRAADSRHFIFNPSNKLIYFITVIVLKRNLHCLNCLISAEHYGFRGIIFLETPCSKFL